MKKPFRLPYLLWLLPLAVAVFAGIDSGITGHDLDSHRGIPVRHNGIFISRSHGPSRATDGTYLGQKWQCVEYVKRFYHQALSHPMPDGTGHARDFYDPAVPHGSINRRRGMLQFTNGGDTPPQVDDLLVFRDGTYGHVAIISAVSTHEVEIIQQNIYGRPRQKLPIHQGEPKGSYTIGDTTHTPAGWLRLPGTR